MLRSYDEVGQGYLATRKPDRGMLQKIAALLEMRVNGIYLDIGCGTGNYTRGLSKSAPFLTKWHGLDCSAVMLQQAYSHASHLSWDFGYAENLPYPDNSFDGIICVNAIHFVDIRKTIKEIARVLKPGATVVIFTILSEQLRNYWLKNYFPEMIAAASVVMPAKDKVVSYIYESGLTSSFLPFFADDTLEDFFLCCGKNRPSIYLVKEVRNNISQFVNLCSAEELRCGLEKLGHDLACDTVDFSSDQYVLIEGDCTYISIKKPG